MKETQSQKVKIDFEENKYVSLPKVIDGQMLMFMYSYIQIFADRFDVVRKHLPKYFTKEEHGYTDAEKGVVYSDPEIGARSISKYGDLLAETMLLSVKDDIENRIGLELIPTYGYIRLYKEGNVLTSHTDRNSCEVSLSLCVGYEGEQWPLYMDGTPIYQEPGDLVIYRGCEIKHWRKPFEGKNQAQMFLHYVDKNGPHGEEFAYDGRPYVGLPVVDLHSIYGGTPFYENKKFFSNDYNDE